MPITLNGTTGIDAPGLSIDGAPVGLTANVQEFTSSGTWTMPANAKLVYVEVWGGGGGGGSGRRSAGANGGGGGGGVSPFVQIYRATELTSTVSVTIGAGGAGGVAQTTNDSFGNVGSSGGSSFFGDYGQSPGGEGGRAGASIVASASAGSTAFGITTNSGGLGGNVGNFNAAQGGGRFTIPFGTRGTNGGGGGGNDSGTVQYAAALGGSYVNNLTNTNTPIYNDGAGLGVSGANGSAFGIGGGGGGPTTSAAGRPGGNGGTAAGGGGGGSSRNGFNSGAGGAGGNGFCRVTTYS